MCGICGLAGPTADEASVRAMMARMPHRGPDDEGLWKSDGIALGHRRLAIVDLSPGGHQPMITDDGSLATVVNGEIYNYPDLRRAYERRGVKFRSNCDSAIVLHAYQAHGAEAVGTFNGMFAFGLWDQSRRTLVLARDRLGIKPVYYHHDTGRGTLAFASEIKALLALSRTRTWPIDPEGLGQYLTYQNVFGQQTLFAGIKMLPPGHILTFTDGRLTVAPFWTPAIGRAPDPPDFATAYRKFASVFQDSVRRHLISDVPVAAYLSAGLDSTMVAATAAPMTGSTISTYTGAFADGGWYDEGAGAELVAKKIGSLHTRVEIGAGQFHQTFDSVIQALDEPRMGMGAFSQYVVAQRVASDRKVILTGHGGDELFSGYPVFKFALLAQHARRGETATLRDLMTLGPSEAPHVGYFAIQSMGAEEGRHFLPVLFSRKSQASIVRRDLWQTMSAFRPSAPLEEIAATARSPYERILLTYLKQYLPGLLVVEDKISMAHALESRTPFLDNELVALSLALSETVKLNGGQLKVLVKSAAKGVLPDALLRMPKRGFPTPLRYWLRGELASWMEDRISGRSSRLRLIFNDAFVDQAAARYRSSWRRNLRPLDEIATHRMWMLLSLESWLRQTEERYGITLTVK